MRDVLITIFTEFLYFMNYQISIFPGLEIWKYTNLKIVEILNSKIMYASRLKCMSSVCKHA